MLATAGPSCCYSECKRYQVVSCNCNFHVDIKHVSILLSIFFYFQIILELQMIDVVITGLMGEFFSLSA